MYIITELIKQKKRGSMLIYKNNKPALICASLSIFALFIIFMNSMQSQQKIQYYNFPEMKITGAPRIQYYSFPEKRIYPIN